MNTLGIDLGVNKISLIVLEGRHAIHGLTWVSDEKQPRAIRLRELGRVAHDTALEFDIDSVWIEDVIVGNNRKYSIGLAQTLGAVLSALAPAILGTGLDVRLVDNKTWKKEVVGNGNSNKDTIRDYITVTYPGYAALCGEDQDLYDASCIALYGRIIEERASHLQL